MEFKKIFLGLILGLVSFSLLASDEFFCGNILLDSRVRDNSKTAKEFFDLYDQWIDSLNFNASIKTKLKSNPAFLPIVIGHANPKLYNTEELKRARNVLLINSFSDPSGVETAESKEFLKFLSTVSESPKVLAGNVALQKLLILDPELKVENFPLKGSQKIFAKYSSRWRHWMSVPRVLSEIPQLLDFVLKPSDLDDNMASFYAFHQMRPDASGTPDRYNRQRPWPKVNLKEINASQIVGMPPALFAAIMKYAMEIEDPIQGYSWASGDALRFLSPELSRFMGKNFEQAELVRQAQKKVKESAAAVEEIKKQITELKAKGEDLTTIEADLKKLQEELKTKEAEHLAAQTDDRWCDSPWCKEEDRHGNMWAQLYRAVTGVTPNRDNPVDPLTPSPHELDALKHLFSRESTEWGATAGYLLLAAHSTGPLREAILNIAQDEVKHLSIITGAHVLLLGRDPLKRFMNMVTKTIADYNDHGEERSGGGEVNGNIPNKIVVISILYGIEKRVRAWMRSLPAQALETIYLTPSRLPTVKAANISAEHLKEIEEAEEASRMIAHNRVRLTAEEHDRVMRELTFGKINKALLDRIIEEEFNSFKGAEVAESAESLRIQRQIQEADLAKYASFKGWIANSLFIGNPRFEGRNPTEADLRLALYYRLREYQIFQFRQPHQKVKDAAKTSGPTVTFINAPRASSEAQPLVPADQQ